MAIGRVSTYAFQQRALNDSSSVQQRLFDLQQQISSGIKTREFSGLSGQVEQFVGLEAKVNQYKQYEDNNQVILTRLRTTNTALDQIVDAVDKLKALIVARRNPVSSAELSFPQQLESVKDQIAAQLNTNVGGRYLFGGTRTDVPPVIEPVPDPVVTGTPDDVYYQGSKEDVVARLQDNVELAYNVRADNSAFQKVFASIAQAIDGHNDDSDDKLKVAVDLAQQGINELIAVQANVNSNILVVEGINDGLESRRLYFKGVTEQLSKTDILEASTQVSLDNAVLTASFQTYARINSLRLSDFLN